MKMFKLALTALVLIQSLSFAAVVSVDMGSGSYNLRTNGGTSLTAGVGGTNGDGALIFLGFYTDGTAANPFGVAAETVDNFVKLSGVGNTFGTANPTIGDNVPFASAGEFFISSLLINDTTNPGALPGAGHRLVVRVLDATTQAGAGYMMEFANPTLWQWVAPFSPPPTNNIDLDDAGLLMRNATNRLGAAAASISGGGNLNANIQIAAVPEPSTFTFGALAALAAAGTRRRRRE